MARLESRKLSISERRRTFYTTSEYYCNSLINDTFIGHNIDEQGQTVEGEEGTDREVFFDNCYDTSSIENININNLVLDCDLYGFGIDYMGYKEWAFGGNGTTECLNPTGVAKLFGTANDSIRIEYVIKKAPTDFENKISKIFVGVRKK